MLKLISPILFSENLIKASCHNGQCNQKILSTFRIKIRRMGCNNSPIGKEKVLYLLRHVLREKKAPVSVSFFNSSYGCRRKCPITEDFMRQFKDEFVFLTVEDDIKIQLKGDSNQPEFVLEEENVNELKKILSKNSDKTESIKKEMLLTKSMSFKDFCEKFSSRKSVVSYPFLC